MQLLTEWSAHLEERLSPVVAEIEAALGADARPRGGQLDTATTRRLIEAVNQVGGCCTSNHRIRTRASALLSLMMVLHGIMCALFALHVQLPICT